MTEPATSMPGTALLATSPHSGGHGTLCVSAPPRDAEIGPLVPPGAGLAVPTSLARPSPAIVRAGGATARASPALLVSLCVSRT